MLLIKLSSIENEENITTYIQNFNKKILNIYNSTSSFNCCTHNANEIKRTPKIWVKTKRTSCENEIWRIPNLFSIFYQIQTNEISGIILHKFWQIFFIIFP